MEVNVSYNSHHQTFDKLLKDSNLKRIRNVITQGSIGTPSTGFIRSYRVKGIKIVWSFFL